MKNMEINKKLGFKVVAVLTSASMIPGGLAGCGREAVQDTDTAVIEQSAEADENDDLLSNVMNQVAHRSTTTGMEPRKDEVVYVMADAQGNTQKIIVSDCLKNANGESTITDASSLTDIKNVKGNESYTVDADGNLVWNADGSDIYYQGTTDKELPVDVSISYELEGKEIAPEDLVGKTGNVTIRFTYTNNEKTTVEVNGKEKEVYVPFAMISGAILPAEHFSDVEVTNGKVISEGDNNIVVGMAFPGLKDSVNIDSLKEKAVDEEAKEKLDEVEIPETVEIHAYATSFEMNQTMTMAMSDLLSDLNMDDTLDIDTSRITDSMNELKDATRQLKDGSTELNDGAATLQEGAQTLADKSRDLDSGAGELKDGAQALNNGAQALNDGAESLNSGAGDLKAGIDQVDSGVSSLKDGTASLVNGASELNSGAGQLRDGINQAAAGVDQLKAGLEADDGLIKGYAAAKAGVQELVGKISGVSGVAGSVTQAVTDLGTYIATQAAAAGQVVAAGEPSAPQFDGSTPDFNGTAPEAPEANEDGSYSGETIAAYIQAVEAYKAAVESYQGEVSNYAGAVGDYQGKVASYSADAANYYINMGKLDAYKDAGAQVQNMAGTLQGAIGGAAGSEEDAAKIQQLLAGMEAISTGLNQLDAGINKLRSGDDGKGGLAALQAGASQLADGTASAVDGAKQLDAGASQLKDGTSQLSSGAQTLKDGTQTLKEGTQTLKEGTISLLNGTVTLKDGTSQFVDGTAELNDGAIQLLDGTGELMDGLFTFDVEGISKLTDLFGDNVQDVIDELKAVCDAGRGYKIYSDSASDMDSSVKFIYKTEAVE